MESLAAVPPWTVEGLVVRKTLGPRAVGAEKRAYKARMLVEVRTELRRRLESVEGGEDWMLDELLASTLQGKRKGGVIEE